MVVTEERQWTEADLADLRAAKKRLEYPGFTARLADTIGAPVEKTIDSLPAAWQEKIAGLAQAVLMKGLELALGTLGARTRREPQDWLHKLLVTVSGGIGGAVGLASLPVELPVTTSIMLRSIADIARSEGHDLDRLATRLECLKVLALGGSSQKDDAVDSGYWAVRTTLAKVVPQTVEKVTATGVGKEVAEQFAKLVAAIAARFSVVVTEEAVAHTIPAIVGAASGSVINLLFMNHFQEMARGHFIILRLEQTYGAAAVQQAYEACAV